MSATGYTVWKALFPQEETLQTEIKPNPFHLIDVATDGIKLRIPATNIDRTITLDYGHLDALWELRDSVDENALTRTVNDVWEKRGQKFDHKNEAQYWALVSERKRREASHRLPDEEARTEPYSPQEGDWRQIVERQIKDRRGQQHFRDLLRKRYGECCLVTGCSTVAVLEAAHIKPYQGENDHHPENGLLLRSDIHTLFDLNLLGIEPERLQLELHPSLAKEYGYLTGKVLRCAPEYPPSNEALRLRYEKFQERLAKKA
jgi:hypothetical protein